jgi:hypothetical protein
MKNGGVTLNIFSSQTEETFSFLVDQYGFTDPVSTDGNWKTIFLYENNDLKVEIELNYDDMDVFVYMMKAENDPEHKKHLEEWMKAERVKSKGTETTIDQFEKTIESKANLLNTYLKEHLPQSINKKIV